MSTSVMSTSVMSTSVMSTSVNALLYQHNAVYCLRSRGPAANLKTASSGGQQPTEDCETLMPDETAFR
jgi:hypothetical protein